MCADAGPLQTTFVGNFTIILHSNSEKVQIYKMTTNKLFSNYFQYHPEFEETKTQVALSS